MMNDTEVTLTARLVGRMMRAAVDHLVTFIMPRPHRPSSLTGSLRNAQIIALVQDGVPVAEVARRFGLHRQRIYQILPPDVDTPGWDHLRSPLRERCRELADQGLSQRAIAEEVGISRSQVRRYLEGYERA